jgi:hypothetical protein
MARLQLEELEPSGDDEEGARRAYGRSDAAGSARSRVEDELRQLRQQVDTANNLAHQWSDYSKELQRQIDDIRKTSKF